MLGERARDRGAPTAADATAFTGGVGIAFGVLLFTIDFSDNGSRRVPGIALFVALIAAGYVALWFLPRAMHAAAVTVIVAGVPGAIGWWILPHANEFRDIRPFLILLILGWTACWLAPRTRGRSIFVAAVLIVCWLWVLGEVAGTDAFSASPVPSPPAHTMFSLGAFTSEPRVIPVADTSSRGITLADLDPSDPLYPLARDCGVFGGESCDALASDAPPGSGFAQFADTCGNSQPPGASGQCNPVEPNPFDNGPPIEGSPFPGLVPGTGGLGTGTDDKSLQIGLVSLLFGILYAGALTALDRRRARGLGTAFVLPVVLALFTGTQALGNAADHAWVGGLLTFTAGVAFAVIGERGDRRFTTWAGGAFAALGAYTFAGDIANLDNSFGGAGASLKRPAFVTLGFGCLLVALSWLLSSARPRASKPRVAESIFMPPLPEPALPDPPVPEPPSPEPPTPESGT